jgi:general L-amino acid transport system permease protein
MGDSAGILSSEERHTAIPFWRDVRVLRWVFQFAILAAVVALFVFLGANLQRNLRAVGLDLNFGFLTRPAGFSISEGPAFPPQNPVWQAYMVGVVNTLRAAGIGILLATLLGTLIGISRLSRNWLLSRIALVYIEIMQNTPLLVQLFFWFTLVKQLPRQRREEMISFPAQAVDLGPIHIPPLAYFSQRGGAIPGIEHLDAFRAWWPFLILGLIAAGVAWRVRVALSERQGHPAVGQFWWAAGAFAAMLAVGWIIVPGAPLRLTIPQLVGEGIIVNYEGGWKLTNNFQALLLGLVLYTAAFIAEAVRSGIQSVPYGQIEAATAQGFTRGQQLRLIILPQAMRVIIPPLINQYLNLTKNSSLAIAVAFPDLFNISQTIGNQTGQNVQIIALVMGSYLAMSLIISAIMNFVNKRMQIVER